jgi:hypothetical protein
MIQAAAGCFFEQHPKEKPFCNIHDGIDGYEPQGVALGSQQQITGFVGRPFDPLDENIFKGPCLLLAEMRSFV